MFASEQLAASQKTQIVAVLRDKSRYESRSVSALAKAINESDEYTADLLAYGEDFVTFHHTGSRSGKVYYTISD